MFITNVNVVIKKRTVSTKFTLTTYLQTNYKLLGVNFLKKANIVTTWYFADDCTNKYESKNMSRSGNDSDVGKGSVTLLRRR